MHKRKEKGSKKRLLAKLSNDEFRDALTCPSLVALPLHSATVEKKDGRKRQPEGRHRGTKEKGDLRCPTGCRTSTYMRNRIFTGPVNLSEWPKVGTVRNP